mmetsp:Transcript_47450/g.94723  ORF Transcript_47450/g.94723 Transcript_47450/m.94723 type:complete len:328 (-) Transcript_47450:200-1183(-)
MSKGGDIDHFLITGASRRQALGDLFHTALKMKWWHLIFSMALLYVAIITLFAGIMAADPKGVGTGIRNAEEGSFIDVFFFSVHTLSTIGYGYMSPSSPWTRSWVMVESFVGVLLTASMTGLFFSKMSEPSARLQFANVLVVHPVDGIPTLMIRLANERRQQILNMKVNVAVLIRELSQEGEQMFAYKKLQLENDVFPLFVGALRLRHTMGADSPIHGLTKATDAKSLGIVAIQMSITGTEEVYGRPIFERRIYQIKDIYFDHKFDKMLFDGPNKELILRLEKLSSVVPIRKDFRVRESAASQSSERTSQGVGHATTPLYSRCARAVV